MTENLSSTDLQKAYQHWLRYYPEQSAEIEFEQHKPLNFQNSKDGLLKKARQALQLSSTHMAEEMKISRSAYCQLEKLEAEGRITLNKLVQAAEAMDCEVVCVLRPKSKVRFSQLIWKKLLPKVIHHPILAKRETHRRAVTLAALVRDQFHDPKTRQELNWTERRTKEI